jgi:DNA-binding LytR/AlgR family response regulator
MNCYIIDDEQFAINVIENYIKQIPLISLKGFTTNPVEGLEYLQKNEIDLVFLDIQMDMLNGLDLMKLLPQRTKVVFCTAYSEFAVAGFELEAVDYLMKPIEFFRFEKAVRRAYNSIYCTTSKLTSEKIPFDYIYVKTEHKGKYLKIFYDEVIFIESKKNYVEFVLEDKKVLVYGSLQKVENQLLSNQFMRVHKSYIVSIDKIRLIENNVLYFQNKNYLVPVSITYRDEFTNRFSDKILRT